MLQIRFHKIFCYFFVYRFKIICINTRVNHDNIEVKMTITDPVMYTKPWVAETKAFRLIPKEEVTAWYEQMTDLKGWYGLMEELCAPVDEIDNFNRRVRDPAGGVTH